MASGSTSTSSRRVAPDPLAVEPERRGARPRSRSTAATRRGAQGRMGQVGAEPDPLAGLEQIAEREGAVGHVEQGVVGVGPGAEVPVAQPLGVHHRHRPADPAAVADDGVGHEPVVATVECTRPRSTGNVMASARAQPRLVAQSPEGLAEVAAQQPERGDRLRRRHGPPRPRGGPRRRCARPPRRRAARPGPPQASPLLDGHGSVASRPVTDDAATTPRKIRSRGLAGGAGGVGVGRGLGRPGRAGRSAAWRCARSRRPRAPRRRAPRRGLRRPPRRGPGRRSRDRAAG